MKCSFLGLSCHRWFQAVQGPTIGPLVPKKTPTAVLRDPSSPGSVSWKEAGLLKEGAAV